MSYFDLGLCSENSDCSAGSRRLMDSDASVGYSVAVTKRMLWMWNSGSWRKIVLLFWCYHPRHCRAFAYKEETKIKSQIKGL